MKNMLYMSPVSVSQNISYLLTPWCKVLEKLTGLQLVKKFPAFLWKRHSLCSGWNVRSAMKNMLYLSPVAVSQNTSYLLTYLLTYSIVQSPWEANWFATSQEIPRVLWNLKSHYCSHKHPPLVPILGQPNPVYIPTSHLLNIHPNIIHPSMPRSSQWSLSVRFPPPRPYTPPSRAVYEIFFKFSIPKCYNIQIYTIRQSLTQHLFYTLLVYMSVLHVST